MRSRTRRRMARAGVARPSRIRWLREARARVGAAPSRAGGARTAGRALWLALRQLARGHAATQWVEQPVVRVLPRSAARAANRARARQRLRRSGAQRRAARRRARRPARRARAGAFARTRRPVVGERRGGRRRRAGRIRPGRVRRRSRGGSRDDGAIRGIRCGLLRGLRCFVRAARRPRDAARSLRLLPLVEPREPVRSWLSAAERAHAHSLARRRRSDRPQALTGREDAAPAGLCCRRNGKKRPRTSTAWIETGAMPHPSGQTRSADAHGNEQLLAVALDQQRDVLAGLLHRALQALDGRHLARADAYDHVARLDARECRGAIDVLDDKAAMANFLLLVARERTHRQAELLVRATARRRAGDLLAVVERTDRRGQRHRLAFTPNLDRDLRSGRHVADAARDVGAVGDRHVVDLADDVARLEARLLGRAVLLDATDDGAVRIGQVEAFRERLVEALDADAEAPMVDLAVL